MKIYKMMVAAFILPFFFLFSGCASMISGDSQNVSITSQPSGAKVLIDGAINGTTPMNIELGRKPKTHLIQITHEGKTLERTTSRGFNWWYLGNLLVGVVGLIVDPCTGAIYTIKPENIAVGF